jgi:hypothetical protein
MWPRLIFYATIVAILAANAFVILYGRTIPADPACVEGIKSEPGQFVPAAFTSDCVATLSADDTQEWWKTWRDKGKDPLTEAERRDLEKCQVFFTFFPEKDPTHHPADKSESACPNARLFQIKMRWLDWYGVNFFDAKFGSPPDGRADLTDANLASAVFHSGDATGIILENAVVRGATFIGTNLTGASFWGADMRGTILLRTTLTDANFDNANLDGVRYEPKLRSLPDIGRLVAAQNLQGLSYAKSPQALSELREALYRAGLNRQARQVTFAIERSRRFLDGNTGKMLDLVSSLTRLVAFEWTVGYGMSPFRPLLILLLLVPAFAPLYVAAIYGRNPANLWIRRPNNAINRVTLDRWIPVRQVVHGDADERFLHYLRIASWFSVTCAFRIGYRDINVGDWITRLQPREYLLSATGWCRTVAGIQSLLSVYLLALAVLCIIGRPFG